MKIEEHILNLLNTKGKVAIPKLGTFITIPAGASMVDDEQVMRPPSLKVAFSEDTYSLEEDSIEIYLKEQEGFDDQSIAYELEAFVKGIKSNVELNGSCELKGLGTFKENSIGLLSFEQDEDLVLGGDSFGLPKIEPKPLSPAISESTPPAPIKEESNRLMIAAIAIPIVVLFFVFLYFLYNRQAYESVMAYFSDTPSVEVQDTTQKNNLQPLADNGNDTDQEGEEGKNGEKDSQGTEKESAKEEVKKPVKEESKPAPQPSSTDLVINNSDNRYYVIIGSFSSLAKAKKKAQDCRKIGYGTAKVVQRGDRIRVSLEDFASKDKAGTFAAKVGKDYVGAWVFTNN